MKYRVTIEENQYIVDVEKGIEENSILHDETGDEISLEIAQNEYNHCFERSSKLDNKVYILLTVCAFLFVMLSEAIKKIGEIQIPLNQNQFIADIGYVALLTLNVSVFVIMLVKLINLLHGVELKRFDSCEILQKDMVHAEKKKVIHYICMVYEQCRDFNNNLIEEQYKGFNVCVKLMVANIIFLLAASLYGSLI